MRKSCLILLILIVVLIAAKSNAWHERTHAFLAEEALADVAPAWGLNRPVVVTSFEQFLEKFSQIHPTIKTREDFADWLQINPQSPFDRLTAPETVGARLTPIAILALHAPAPDDGRDQALPYHPLTQVWFGGAHKANSQAFRHMEKVAFDPLRPLDTFGFPIGTAGEASERAQIYFDLASLAIHLGEPYWGWRFLGDGFHYLEDLLQPYHTFQLSLPLLMQGGASLEKIAKAISDSHRHFEDLAEAQVLTPRPELKRAIHGTTLLKGNLTIQELAKQGRDFANRYAHNAVLATEATDREAINAMLLKLFEFQGTVLRTAVAKFLTEGGSHAKEEKGR